MTTDRAAAAHQLIDRHFIGAAFEDTLFNVENELREKACSWKIMSSMIYFSALSNDTWRWRAIGIPLNLLSPDIQGDIDLLFAMQPAPGTVENRRVFPPVVYRCFELKTAKVNRTGDVKALKRGKFHKTIGQLEKLCDIGAQQVFLLEAFIVEAGYSRAGQTQMPIFVRDSIAEKYEQIMRADYGYVAMAIEQMEGFAENGAGILWPTATVKSAAVNQPSGPFLEIIKNIEAYIERSGANRRSDVVTYCYACRNLTHTHRAGPYTCRDCKTPFI